jgi:hypothetical protein
MLAAIKPDPPTNVISQNVGSDAEICWTEPYDRGSPIFAYKIYIKTVTNTYEQQLDHCDGSDPAIVVASCCTIPLTVFKAAPYNLFNGDHIYAKVTAINLYGESVASQVGDGASLLVVPDAPVNLKNNAAVTDSTKIGITWSNGSSTGGAPILDYEVVYEKEGDADWISLSTTVTTTSYQTTVELVGGENYLFKVRTRNSVGYSQYSTSVTIRAARIPDAPTNVDTSVVDGYSVISWTAPYNGGTPITAYHILI